ncbi:MAG TPA: DUF3368 domain-containing protein [bacterium]|nr:DUF3368 domain-containing protein [bacterium]HQL63628.1 DUF3368 domain-containing protein [bacterium]
MPERPAVNASPLIFLAKADLLDLLQLVGKEIVVPAPVAREIEQRGRSDPTARAIENTAWLVVLDIPSVPEQIQSWDLGIGESSVLAWAYSHPGTIAILDDLAARRCAATLGIPVRGTLGLVLAAKKLGRISKARPILDKLRSSGMYLSERIVNEALSLVGE